MTHYTLFVNLTQEVVNKEVHQHRFQILTALKSEDRFFSGEELSQLTGISRVAVRKHILCLKDNGYSLQSGRTGYKLERKNNDFLYDWEFNPEQEIRYLKKTDSTMNEARRKADYSDRDFTIVSGTQDSGKDIEGNNWNSPEGGLYLTHVSYTPMPLTTLPLYPLYIQALLTIFFQEKEKGKVTMIWPSRFETESGISGGILCEHNISACRIRWSAIGIGIKADNSTKRSHSFNRKDYLEGIETILTQNEGIPEEETIRNLWLSATNQKETDFAFYRNNKINTAKISELKLDGSLIIQENNRERILFPDKIQ